MTRYQIIPYHRAGAVKMHANQTEETSEQAQYDRLHVQKAVSFFQKIPIAQQNKSIHNFSLCQVHSQNN